MDNLKKGVDFIGVCVVFFCHDGKGNIIFAKRSQKTRDEQGRWDIGSGSMEFEHSVEETLKKEIGEEYGTTIVDYEFLGYRDVLRMNNDRETHWISLDFKVRVDPATVKNGEPGMIEEIGWFTLNTMPEPLHSQLPKFFESYRKKLETF